MANKVTTKAKGLYTDPNLLSEVPPGALVEADNVIIDRDSVLEPRRGFNQYGNTFGVSTDTANQLLVYKNRILIHFNSTLLFNDNPHNNDVDGNFLAFDGVFQETEPGLRIKGIESNRNFYFTTADGIKKISAVTADDFTTAAGFIRDAGGVKALDVTGNLNPGNDGFLPPNSKVAYRIVWGYKDANENLILGAPSSRLVITNFSDVNSNVDLEFSIPQSVDTNFFYQIYRTAVFTATGNLTLDDIDPGDEMNLVVEDFPTAAQLVAGTVTITDIAPEDFRAGGLPLYTNPSSGEGIGQANEPPPKAKDLALYQNSLFYANTENRARTTISLLSVLGLVSGVSQFIVTSGLNVESYTFVGEKEETEFDFSSYTGTIPADLNGKYALFNCASNKRKYYLWYDTTKTTQEFDFTGYVGTIPADLDTRYVTFYSAGDRQYYLWFDATGTSVDPGLDPANTHLAGLISIRVDVTGDVTTADIAASVAAELTTNNVFNDYDVVYTGGNTFVEIETESFDSEGIEPVENVQKGFSYEISTPTNDDPANTPLVNTDVVGRIGIRVNVSRNVTTKAQVADASAAAILEQDNAGDFTVTYNTSDEFFTIENTNNGNTDDAVDSGIEPIGNGFAITVLNQGDGEDAALNHVLLSAAATPAQQIDETARSLVNIINKNASENVYAFYISGPTDIPGQILLEVKDIGTNSFSLTADNATTGALFNPALPPAVGAAAVEGEIEVSLNRIYFSKIQQPEAVPLLNFIDVGPKDQAISRILALRESLFILKQDGTYRLTGLEGNFTVDLFDESTKIISPDTAVVLNNQIYCLSNQGVVVISDTGIQVVSKQLDNIFQQISSANFDFEHTSFGVSYETDRAYWLWVPTIQSDDVATQAFRYNTATTSWTRHTMSKTCGVVNRGDNKMYLGASDENFIERERKNFNRTDYADREFDLTLPANAIEDNNLELSQTGFAKIGDAIVQTQYLTISEFNNTLKKLDLDPFVGGKEKFEADFSGYTGSIPNDLHQKYFIMYSASDNNKYAVFCDATGSVQTLDTNIFTDVADAQQIRVDISTGVTTAAQLANKIQNTIKSSTLEFIVTYTIGTDLFTVETIRSGVTTNASDGGVNGIGNGFVITTLAEGFGNYFETVGAEAGDNMKSQVEALATKLDADPNVQQTDYVAAIDTYSGVGATITFGNPTIITFVGHGLQTGRLATISNSTSTPSINGNHIITRIDNDNFSIPVTTTVGGTCDFMADVQTFEEVQAAYNTIIIKLNDDAGVFYTNYQQSEGTKELEALIVNARLNSPVVELEFKLNFIQGPITLYRGIITNLVYSPEFFGDPSLMKHVREGTFMFENNNFSRASVGYKSDLSPGIDSIPFERSGKGDWSFFIWGNQNWGGGFSGVPLRTYIPRNKQRCRYIQAQFTHNSAREKWALFGISYTVREISEKAYRA